MMTSLFLLSTPFSSGPIFQHHHFTIHTLFWDQCSDFLDIAQLLSLQLLKQCNVAPRLKTSLHKFYGRHHVDRYVFLYLTSSRWSLRISISQMTMDLFLFTYMFFFFQNWLHIGVTQCVSYYKQDIITILTWRATFALKTIEGSK